MKKAALGIIAIAALIGTPVLAADMALKALPPPSPPTWAGWYVGINGGGGREQNNWSFPVDQFFTTAAGQGFSTNPSGGLVGGHFGYNAQWGQWVVGAEFDGDWTGLSQTLVGPVTPTYPLDSYTTKLYDLETLTLRVGYAPGQWLWYGKGGIATGTVNLNVVSGAPVAGVAFSNTQRQWGPTAGAGVEYMFAPHFVIGVEYDFAALSSESISTNASCNGAATCTGSTVNPVTMNSGTFGISTVVGRASYKF